jgi:hypothetical protein
MELHRIELPVEVIVFLDRNRTAVRPDRLRAFETHRPPVDEHAESRPPGRRFRAQEFLLLAPGDDTRFTGDLHRTDKASTLRFVVAEEKRDIDNNVVERAVRPVAVGWRNRLFCGSEKGG